MAGGVTYNGVSTTSGGNIFKDVKFWVAQRIPSRAHYIDLITSNSGTVVPLEKNADMLIADGARKDIPPGSYSWKFIEDSVKNGIAQLKDRYEIGLHAKVAQTPQGGASKKLRRVAFTTEDDVALVKWVMSHPLDRMGNRIYQEWATMNDRHTWHSWQSRWRKKLAALPPKQLKKMAADADALPVSGDGSEQSGDSAPGTGNKVQENGSTPIVRKSPISVRTREVSNLLRAEDISSPPRAQNMRQPARTREISNLPRAQETSDPPRARESSNPPTAHEIQQVFSEHVNKADPNTNPTPSETSTTSNPERDEFYADLQKYADDNKMEISFDLDIDGVTVTIWDLVQTVNSVPNPVEEFDTVDWVYVTQELGLNHEHEGQVEAIRLLYEDFVGTFFSSDEEDGDEEAVEGGVSEERGEEEVDKELDEEYMGDDEPYEEQEGGEEDDDEEKRDEDLEGEEMELFYNAEQAGHNKDDEVFQVFHSEPHLPSEPPSSPPIRHKRPNDHQPSSTYKRRRLDPDLEIPSTPEEHLRHRQLPTRNSTTPRNPQTPRMWPSVQQRDSSQRDISPTLTLKTKPRREIKSSQDDTHENILRTPNRGPTQTLQRGETGESGWDISPNQQLGAEGSSQTGMDRGRRDADTSEDEETPRARRRDVGLAEAGPSRVLRSMSRDVSSNQPRLSRLRRSMSRDISEPQSSVTKAFKCRKLPASFNQPPSTRKQPSTQAPQPRTLQEWITHYQSLNYPLPHITKALHATTMTPGPLIPPILSSLESTNTLPTHIEGVWTARDDDALKLVMWIESREPSDAAEFRVFKAARKEGQRLDRKHGGGRVELRKGFLKGLDEVEYGRL